MKLRAAREASGMTQAQVATAIGKTVQQYQNYEQGKCLPKVDVALRLASLLRMSVAELFGEKAHTQTE